MKKFILILFFSLSTSLFSQEERKPIMESPPTYPGCDFKYPRKFDSIKYSNINQKKRKCLSEKMGKFIGKEFNTSIARESNVFGKVKIRVIFKIDTLGRVVGVRARAPHKRLEKEAIRVVKMLPISKPGIKDGKKVNVPYHIPIDFEIF